MDAVSLALPVNNLPNPAVSTGDGPGVGAQGTDGPQDFATLLAAGIDLQRQLFDATGAPTEAACGTDTGCENVVDPNALAADPSATLTAPQALPMMPVQVHERPAHADALSTQGSDADRRIAAALLARNGADAAQAAAEAARIAAAPAEGTSESAPKLPEFRLETMEDMQALAATTETQRADAAEAAVQTLNAQSVEQRPAVHQPVAVREVGAPVGSAGFADELSRQVVWMVDKDAQIAELRINPPDLGPVEVRLSVSGDHATAQFVSTHSEVREALETSIARLRESFAEAGIQLGEASVSAESFRDQTAAGQTDGRSERTGYPDRGNTLAAAPGTSLPTQRMQRGLVDTFA